MTTGERRSELDTILNAIPDIPQVQQDERDLAAIIQHRREVQGETFGTEIEWDGEIYKKTQSGGWFGPGGNYGPMTPRGRDLEDKLRQIQQG